MINSCSTGKWQIRSQNTPLPGCRDACLSPRHRGHLRGTGDQVVSGFSTPLSKKKALPSTFLVCNPVCYDDSPAVTSGDHSLLPKTKGKTRKEFPTHPSKCTGLTEKTSSPASRNGKADQPLGCFIPHDADGRHSSFTQACQRVSEVLTHKTTEHREEKRLV